MAAFALLVVAAACLGEPTPGSVDAGRAEPSRSTSGDAASEAAEPPAKAPLASEWVYVPAGTFRMGSPRDEPGRLDTETPHQVTLTTGFVMQPTEVTQEQFEAVMGYNPSHFYDCGPSCPVEDVSWHQAAVFCNRVSEAEGLRPCYICQGGGPTATCERNMAFASPYLCPGYRLPTEAEWEHAARAGERRSTFLGSLGEDQIECESPNPLLDPYAWYCGNSGGTTHPVGQKEPSSRGLYDLLGNVWEWNHDFAAPFVHEPATDPWGPPTGAIRVGHGGAWVTKGRLTRFAARGGGPPERGYGYLGFRMVRSCLGDETASFCRYHHFARRPRGAASGDGHRAATQGPDRADGADGADGDTAAIADAGDETTRSNRRILVLVVAGVLGLFIGERLARWARRRRAGRRRDSE